MMPRAFHYAVLLIALFPIVEGGSIQRSKASIATATPQIITDELDSKAWKEFSSPEGRFAILMPGTPKEEIQSNQTDMGQRDIHTFSLQTSVAVYMATYTDFPITVDTQELIDKILDGARSNLLANNTRKLLDESKISLNGFSGREMRIGLPDLVLTTRFYMVNRRLYQVIIIMAVPDKTSKQKVEQQNTIVTKFLGSLRIAQADTKKS